MKILYRVEYFFFICLAFLIRIVPRNSAYFIGRVLGFCWSKIARNRYQIAFDNLTHAYPEYSNSQKKEIIANSFKNMALSAVDLFRLDLYSQKDFETLIDFEGKEYIEKAYQKSDSVIFMTAHLGFWESGAFVFPFLGLKVNFISKTIKNPLINAYVLRKRSFFGGEGIDKRNGVRKMLKTLQEKKSIAILIDQHSHKEESVFVPFFGRKAYTSPIIVNLATKKNIPIVPIFCYREPKNRLKIVVQEPIYFAEDSDNGATNTTAINLILENAIRKNPEQWMWFHRRWRSE